MQVSGAPHSLHLTSNLYVVPVVPSAPPTKNLAHRAPIERAVVQDLKSSGSVRCIKHNNPDHRDKSEAHKRGQRHELLPVIGLWTEPPNLSVTVVTSLSQDQCFATTPPSSPAVP
jgi:hypothetical protein